MCFDNNAIKIDYYKLFSLLTFKKYEHALSAKYMTNLFTYLNFNKLIIHNQIAFSRFLFI